VEASNAEVKALIEGVYEALCDDLNTPIALSHVFDAVRIINTVKDKKMTLEAADYKALVDLFDNVVYGVLGLRDEEASEGGKAIKTIDGLMNMVLEQRKAAKAAKDWATSDRIRDDLKALAGAAGVQSAPALAYGEFVSAVAPTAVEASNAEVKVLVEGVYEALCDDLNTPIALSHVFDAVRIINTVKDKKLALDVSDYKALVDLFDNVVYGVLGLRDEEASEGGKAIKTIDGLMNMVLEQRKAAKAAKDWATSDRIRDDLKALGIQIKDGKDGTEWTLE
jgi:cysteinyl-tRNA synthetase